MAKQPKYWTLDELAAKMAYEGGIGDGLLYYGREMSKYVDDPEFAEAWKRAYDAMEVVKELLPDVEEV